MDVSYQETGSRCLDDKKRYEGSNFLRKPWGSSEASRQNTSYQRH
jgi:hypothetical protein